MKNIKKYFVFFLAISSCQMSSVKSTGSFVYKEGTLFSGELKRYTGNNMSIEKFVNGRPVGKAFQVGKDFDTLWVGDYVNFSDLKMNLNAGFADAFYYNEGISDENYRIMALSFYSTHPKSNDSITKILSVLNMHYRFEYARVDYKKNYFDMPFKEIRFEKDSVTKIWRSDQ